MHVPDGSDVAIVEVDRGGKSTYHAPGQLVCYPIFDLARHGQDVQRFCRDLEEALIRTMAAFNVAATRIEGLTGVWLESPPRKIASIGIHLTRWISTHGYALNVDLDPAPFTEWITACGLDGYAFTSMARELGRPLAVDDVRPAAAQALADARARIRRAGRTPARRVGPNLTNVVGRRATARADATHFGRGRGSRVMPSRRSSRLSASPATAIAARSLSRTKPSCVAWRASAINGRQ